MRTVNKRVACSLFPETSIRVEVKSGVAIVKQKAKLTKLEVIFDYSDADVSYRAGDEVWVRGDTVKASEVYEIDDKPFSLVPRELIIAHRRVDKHAGHTRVATPYGNQCVCPPENSFLDK